MTLFKWTIFCIASVLLWCLNELCIYYVGLPIESYHVVLVDYAMYTCPVC